MSLSKKLFQQAQKVIPGGVNSPVRSFKNVGGDPIFVQKAYGAYVEDVDGKKYIDFIGTWGPAILGHAPIQITNAIHETAKQGLSFGLNHATEITMAQKICQMVPSIEKVRMVNSGTEATMTAIRLARGFTGRKSIIKFEGCYHGHVDSLLVSAGSGALTHGKPDSAGVPEELSKLTYILTFNDKEILKELLQQKGKEISAIILEPVMGNAGLIKPKEYFLEFLREITMQYGIILIFDEVMTGFRLSAGGAQEIYGIKPDLTALGKIIGGGMPVGAIGGRADIMDKLSPLGDVYQAGTLSGNPLALTAGLTQINELEKNNAWQKLEMLGQLLQQGIEEIISYSNVECNFARVGSMFCLYFCKNEVNSFGDLQKNDIAKFTEFFNFMKENGVLIAPSPYEVGFISTAHSEENIKFVLEKITQFFSKIS